MLSMNRELRMIVNPLRKRDIPAKPAVVDKPKGGGAGGGNDGRGGGTAGVATRASAKAEVKTPPTIKPKEDDESSDSSDNKTNDDPLATPTPPQDPGKPESLSKSVESEEDDTMGATTTEEDEGKIAAEVGSGSQLSQSDDNNVATSTKAKCTSCQCEKRLEALEGEISDLKTRMEGRKQLEDIISSWKEEVDKWMLSKFGFSVSLSSSSSGSGSGANKTGDKTGSPGNGPKSDVVICPTSGNLIQRFFDEGEDDEEEECISEIPNSPMDTTDTLEFSTEEPVNVEITPDIFGHFLLGGDQEDYEQGQPEEIIMDDSEYEVDDQEGDGTQAGPSVKTQIIKMTADEENDDTDSDCYTVSDESSESEDSSSEDDYLPAGGRGRGKGKPQNMPSNKNSQVASTSGQSIRNTNPNAPKPAPSRNSALLNPQTRKELLQHCKPKPGNLWECNVCGFMLASLENMLLHVKYNHSTSTHTCPFCRVIVLCRSPKDAALHQSTCKMRLPGSKVRTPKYSFKHSPASPSPSSSAKSDVPFKKPKVEDINAKVNKFIDDILDPSSTTTAEILGKNKTKNSKSPAVVTLSSDEDE